MSETVKNEKNHTEIKKPKKNPESLNENNQKKFPKEVGIIFLESIYHRKRPKFHNIIHKEKEWKPYLDFNQDACTYFLTQMNSVQQLFEFQIIVPDFDDKYDKDDFARDFSIPAISDIDNDYIAKKFGDWSDNLINQIRKQGVKTENIDYWIFITSEDLPGNWNFRNDTSEKKWVVTSETWQREYAPPSLFEYLAITSFTCALYALAQEYRLPHDSHRRTKSCLFDFTAYKAHRKILVSSPWLCNSCTDHFQQLEQSVAAKADQVKLLDDIMAILSRNWIGKHDEIGTPAYNLKKDYGFDLNANSGFYKSAIEQIHDFIKEHQILTLVLTAIGMILAVFGIATP